MITVTLGTKTFEAKYKAKYNKTVNKVEIIIVRQHPTAGELQMLIDTPVTGFYQKRGLDWIQIATNQKATEPEVLAALKNIQW